MTTVASSATPAQRSLRVFPAGSNGEFNLPESLVPVIERGDGCRLWTADGTEMLDFSMGWGSVLPGHAHPEIVRAVQKQAPLGSNFAFPTTPALTLAERIIELSPACDQIRFCASGTEATMYCLRLARAFSGKPKILRFEGAYHGANDVGVTSLFPTGNIPFPAPEPTSAGLGPGTNTSILVAPFNDIETTRSIITGAAHELAAVIVEPFHRCLPPVPGFLERLREVCDTTGTLLIFDEVVTGFRFALGGAQEFYGVTPDLVAYGKALGGGYPIGAFGGSRDIMSLVREDGLGTNSRYVWTASTLGGNPISTAAANAALDLYSTPGTYNRLHETGERLRTCLERALADTGIRGYAIGQGPLGQIALSAKRPVTSSDMHSRDKQTERKIMLGLFRRGVFLNPMGTKLYLSLAHTTEDIEELGSRLASTLTSL